MSEKKYTDAENVRHWWRQLSGNTINEATQNVLANPGALAELRRIRTPHYALLSSHAINLVQLLNARQPKYQIAVASLAVVLAHVREDDPGYAIATRLGGSKEDDRLMKPARFRRLMLAETGEERLTAFRRAIQMLKGRANVKDIATAWLLWDHEEHGDRIRVDWMFRYVGVSGNEFSKAAQRVDINNADVGEEPMETNA